MFTQFLSYINAKFILILASILHELSDSQPNMNNVKLEHPAYYCNSYPDQSVVPAERSSSVDPMVVSAAYCEYNF